MVKNFTLYTEFRLIIVTIKDGKIYQHIEKYIFSNSKDISYSKYFKLKIYNS